MLISMWREAKESIHGIKYEDLHLLKQNTCEKTTVMPGRLPYIVIENLAWTWLLLTLAGQVSDSFMQMRILANR